MAVLSAALRRTRRRAPWNAKGEAASDRPKFHEFKRTYGTHPVALRGPHGAAAERRPECRRPQVGRKSRWGTTEPSDAGGIVISSNAVWGP